MSGIIPGEAPTQPQVALPEVTFTIVGEGKVQVKTNLNADDLNFIQNFLGVVTAGINAVVVTYAQAKAGKSQIVAANASALPKLDKRLFR